jgi:3-deoxy-D-manno-octulosonic-acid transferase
VKFDVDIPDALREASQKLKASFFSRPVWIAGSTHEGEDAQLLAAHRQLLNAHPNALLILVPRHPERFESVTEKVGKQAFTLARRSLAEDPSNANVYLGDTMGELMMLYGSSDVAFVGGSLIERGGHNPLEPAGWGIPVISGPHVFNFETIYQRLLDDRGVTMVSDAGELYRHLAVLFGDAVERQASGKRALSVVNKNRGALDRVVDGIIERV